MINRADKLICLHTCLHKLDRAGLIYKPNLVKPILNKIMITRNAASYGKSKKMKNESKKLSKSLKSFKSLNDWSVSSTEEYSETEDELLFI